MGLPLQILHFYRYYTSTATTATTDTTSTTATTATIAITDTTPTTPTTATTASTATSPTTPSTASTPTTGTAATSASTPSTHSTRTGKALQVLARHCGLVVYMAFSHEVLALVTLRCLTRLEVGTGLKFYHRAPRLNEIFNWAAKGLFFSEGRGRLYTLRLPQNLVADHYVKQNLMRD